MRFLVVLFAWVVCALPVQALTITQAQYDKLMYIQAHHSPRHQEKAIKRALLAKQVDTSALRNCLNAEKSAFKQQFRMLALMRGVLTPAQRAEVLRDFNNGRPSLFFVPQQTSLLGSLDQVAFKHGIIALLKNGDCGPLNGLISAIPVEPLVFLASWMSQEQRRKLVGQLGI